VIENEIVPFYSSNSYCNTVILPEYYSNCCKNKMVQFQDLSHFSCTIFLSALSQLFGLIDFY
jgi:hypothetical protein